MSCSIGEWIQTVAYVFKGILLSYNKDYRSTQYLDKTQKHCPGWKKPDTKECRWHRSTYVKLWNEQNELMVKEVSIGVASTAIMLPLQWMGWLRMGLREFSWRIKIFYTPMVVQITWMYMSVRTDWTEYLSLAHFTTWTLYLNTKHNKTENKKKSSYVLGGDDDSHVLGQR